MKPTEDLPLPITCPHCGADQSRPWGEVKTNPSTPCTACGHTITIDVERIERLTAQN